MKSITVVIPVYKDWESLNRCLESLKKYLDRKHPVVLINDMGNDWKLLENKIETSIKEYNNFSYYKNEENIGFVKSCNRGVFELADVDNDILLLNSDTEVTEGFLEEMNTVLYSDDRIGAVCPRSNKASFLSVPVHRNDKVNVTREQSFHIYREIQPFLPRVEEIWTGVGFAFLVKREVINKFGLFDEVYGRGYNEENDFCMRIRKAGYIIAKANHAFVFHDEGKSFSNEKEKLELKNSSILLKRYPDYWDNAKRYQNLINPVDYFSDLLVKNVKIYQKQRVLLCAMRKMDVTETKQAISDIKNIINTYSNDFDFHLLVPKKNYRRFKAKFSEKPVWTSKTLTGTYHIIYSLSQLDKESMSFLCGKGIMIYEKSEIKDLAFLLQTLKKQIWLKKDNLKQLYDRWGMYDGYNAQSENLYNKPKMYLYTHHIWIFLWWRKIKNAYAGLLRRQ